jgi:hypothetical protein
MVYIKVSESNPSSDKTDKYVAESSGFLSFLRRDNRITRNNIFVSRQKKTDTVSASFWETISENFYNRLRAFGIIDPSSMEAKFDFEFHLPTKDHDMPMFIQIKKCTESEATKTVDIETLQKQVADIIGNSKLQRFVAELDKNGDLHPIYFIDFKGNVVSL